MRKLAYFALMVTFFAACGSGQSTENTDPKNGNNPSISGQSPGDQLVPYRKGELYGYATRDRKIVIEPTFEQAELFNEGVAGVKKDGFWGAIRPNGEFAVPPKFYNRFPLKFHRGLAYVDLGGNAGYIDTVGNFIIPPNYFASPHIGRNYWPAVRFGERYGLFNLEGQKITGWDFDFIWEYQEGMAMFRVKKEGEDLPSYGFVDTTGAQAIPPIYSNVTSYSEGLAWVGKDGKYGTIDKTGKEVIPLTYPFTSEYKEGLAGNSIDGMNWGFIDREGNVVIDFQFQAVTGFVDGFARVMMAQQMGLINKKGELVHPCNLQDVGDFYQGLATVMKGGKFGFMNKDWEMVIPFKYEGAKGFKNGIALTNNDKMQWGYIDLEGNEFFED